MGLYIFCVPLRKSADKKKIHYFCAKCSSTKSDEKAESSNTRPLKLTQLTGLHLETG